MMQHITADTNVLLRAVLGDDEMQQKQALTMLQTADAVFIPTTVLCELVWILMRSYKLSRLDTAETLAQLMQIGNVMVATDEAMAGLALLRSGGDFADGVNEYSGRLMGEQCFVTFDKKAVQLLSEQGKAVILLA